MSEVGHNRIPLEELFELLQAFGRPTMNQAVTSASPGYKAAGQWFVEVSVPPLSYEALGRPNWYFSHGQHPDFPRGFSHVARRMSGSGSSPREAAERCLERCIELREGPAGRYFDFVDVDEARRREDKRKP